MHLRTFRSKDGKYIKTLYNFTAIRNASPSIYKSLTLIIPVLMMSLLMLPVLSPVILSHIKTVNVSSFSLSIRKGNSIEYATYSSFNTHAGEQIVWTLHTNGTFRNPLIYDIYNTNSSAIIVTSTSGSLYVVDLSEGIIYLNITFNESLSSPALGYLDKDAFKDIVVSGSNNTVYAISAVTQSILWCVKLNASFSTPALADLNHDGYDDVVIPASDKNVYALSGIDGDILWNRTLNETASNPALGDLNRDGYIDVVVSSGDGFVYGINGINGTILWMTCIGQTLSEPTLCDYNNDGIIDVLVARHYESKRYAFGELYEVSAAGGINLLDGDTGKVVWGYGPKGGVFSPVIVGDVNNDGKLEAVYFRSYYHLTKTYDGYILDASEASYQAVTICGPRYQELVFDYGSSGTSSALTVDLNNDNILDILIGDSKDSLARGFDANNKVQIWQSSVAYDAFGAFAVGILDSTQNTIAIVICKGGRMDVLRLPNMGFRIYWSNYGGDVANTRSTQFIDPDGDTISSYSESIFGTNPFSNDTDDDGFTDIWELSHGYNPLNNSDANDDADNDGLTNIEEYRIGTDIFDNDTDDDRMPDGWEVKNGLNPFDYFDRWKDPDGDGLENYEEYYAGTDPHNPDTDGDYLNDNIDIFPTNFYLPHISVAIGLVGLSILAGATKKTKHTLKEKRRKNILKKGKSELKQKGYVNYWKICSMLDCGNKKRLAKELSGSGDYKIGKHYVISNDILNVAREKLFELLSNKAMSREQIVSTLSRTLNLPADVLIEVLRILTSESDSEILQLGEKKYVSILIVKKILSAITQQQIVSILQIMKSNNLTTADWTKIRPMIERAGSGEILILSTFAITRKIANQILTTTDRVLKEEAMYESTLVKRVATDLKTPREVVSDVLSMYKSKFMVLPGGLYCSQSSLNRLLKRVKNLGRINISKIKNTFHISDADTQYILNTLLINKVLVSGKSEMYYTKGELKEIIEKIKQITLERDAFTVNELAKQVKIPKTDAAYFFDLYIRDSLGESKIIKSLDNEQYYKNTFFINEIKKRSKIYAKISLTKMATEYNISKKDLETIVAEAISNGDINGKISDDTLILLTEAMVQTPPIPQQVPGAISTIAIPNYKIVGVLGQGGFATVFKAIDLNEKTEVGLKVINVRDSTAKKTIAREISLWKLLDHPNIVKLLDFGVEPLPYIVMELMDGTLRNVLQEKSKIDERTAIQIIKDVAKGLAYVHNEYYILHRDIKPENILYKGKVWKLSDWGLATVQSTLTVSGFKGTLAYAAPEQIDTEIGKISQWTDIWQLGAVFYELVAGEPPFGIELSYIIKKVLSAEPVKPENVSNSVWRIIQSMLRKKPQERITIDELIRMLEEL